MMQERHQHKSLGDTHPSSSASFDQAPAGILFSGASSQQQPMHGQAQHLSFHDNQQYEDSLFPQHELSRKTRTLSAQCSVSPSQSLEPRKISCQDIQEVCFSRVKNLIERCLQLYMNQKEVIGTLFNQAKVEPCFTRLVWQRLEEQNPAFFKAYYMRLKVKQQILKFNQLLGQQAAVMDKMVTARAPEPISNGMNSSGNHGSQHYSTHSSEISSKSSRGNSLLHSSSSLVNDAGLPSMHISGDNFSSRKKESTSSNIPSALPHHYHGISLKRESDIEPNPGVSNGSNFIFSGFNRSADTQSNAIATEVPNFTLNETHLQAGLESLLDHIPTGQKDLVGLNSYNFSLSDLPVNFTQAADILESYSESPFLMPERFLHSPNNERLDDNSILDTVLERLSYDDFTSD